MWILARSPPSFKHLSRASLQGDPVSSPTPRYSKSVPFRIFQSALCAGYTDKPDPGSEHYGQIEQARTGERGQGRGTLSAHAVTNCFFLGIYRGVYFPEGGIPPVPTFGPGPGSQTKSSQL